MKPIKDQDVKCLNCGFRGLVSAEDDDCPKCNKPCLTWADDEREFQQ